MLSAIPEGSACVAPGNAFTHGETSGGNASEISVNVKRTFIELVATPKRSHRVRALTDTDLLLSGDDNVSSTFSDASTGTPADEEEAEGGMCNPPAEWASPCWGPSEDTFYHGDAVPEPLLLPAGVDQVMCDPSFAFNFPFPVNFEAMPWDPQLYFDPNSFDPSFLPHAMQSGDCEVSDAKTSIGGQVQSCDSTSSLAKTTIMLRNLPSMYTRPLVIEMLEDEDFAGCFDLVYVPMDFSGKCCLGYAFVNFLTPQDAIRCWDAFDGFLIGEVGQAACEVVWSDPHQGVDALIERYRNSPVMHESVPEDWKPAYFVSGVRVPFPAPTEKVKAPKQKNTRSKTKRDY